MLAKPKSLTGVYFRSGKWWLQFKVPLDLRPVIGKTQIMVNLKTDSPSEAAKRAPAARQAARRIIQRARSGETLEDIAQEFRDEIRADDDAWYPASDWLDQIEAKHGEAKALDLAAVIRGERTSLADLLDRYLNAEPSGRSDTLSKRQGVSLWIEHTGIRHIEGVTRQAKNVLTDALLQDRQRSTVNKLCTRLTTFGKWIERQGYSDKNVFDAMTIKAPRSRRRAFTDAELRALLEHSLEPLKSLIIVLALTGLRISEALSLRPENVDFEQGFLEVTKSKTPAGKRIVAIHPQAHSSLRHLVMVRTPERSLRVQWKRSMDRAGLERDELTFHSLRKWFYSTASKNGAEYLHLSAVMGHALPNLARTYEWTQVLAQSRDVVERVELP